jgi:tripartite-type tricarboxylate transporter receptor subunit TctC
MPAGFRLTDNRNTEIQGVDMRKRLAALCLLTGCAFGAQAQTAYPTKPIKFIVGYTAGGLGDTFARAMGQGLGHQLGQPIVIENRPGGSQVIALDAAAKSAPDGYTLVYGTQSGMVFTTASKKSLPYDPLKDFSSIGMLFDTPFYLIVHPSLPVKSVREFIAYAKANPGKLSFASIGVGSGQHLAMELFRSRTGIDMVHVPYKGSAPASLDLLSGRVQVMFEGPATSLPNVRSGKIRALATSGTHRTRSMPDLPTVAEAGVPGYEMATWFGVESSAGVPRPIITKLNQAVHQWLKSAEAQALAQKFSLELTPSTPEEMSDRIRREIPVFVQVMKSAGIEPE